MMLIDKKHFIADIPRHSFERLLESLQPCSKLEMTSILPT
jgi:hypothetical protein